MLRFIFQKLAHKKWMVICLLIGNILLCAIAASNPMYREAALKKTLKSKFSAYIEENNKYPGVVTFEASMSEGKGQEEEFKQMQTIANGAAEELDVTRQYLVEIFMTSKIRGKFLESRGTHTRTKSMRLVSMTDLKDHVNILAGEMAGNAIMDDGTIPVVLSQRAMTKLDVVLGDKLSFEKLKNADGSEMTVTITGVFDVKDSADSYWIDSPSEYYMDMFVDSDLFNKLFVNLDKTTANISGKWHMIYDYKSVLPRHVDDLIEDTEELVAQSQANRFSQIDTPAYLPVLKEYRTAAKKVSTTLLILQIPVLSLLLAFIFMISAQMLDLEQNEIALLKSRGSSRFQIIFIYFIQSAILSGASCIVGLPLGFLITKALGSTNGFLEFIQRKALDVSLTGSTFLYLLFAMAVSISFMVLPVVRDSKTTIVDVKHKNAKRGKNILSKVYLDVILLVVSIYGLYSFNSRKEELMKDMLEGGSIDPFLFICSSLFIIAAGIVALRLHPLIVKLVYTIGKKFWKPAGFASFLQIMRTGSKLSFMMVFLMFTVSLGIFNATVARTILSNSEKCIRYTTGADLVLQQPWEDNSLLMQYYEDLELTYIEPDFGTYENMEGVESATKVYIDNEITNSYVKSDSENEVKTTLMGIDTKSFGETVTDFQKDLLPVHINRYLNSMAKRADAVLLSSNYQKNYGIRLGDKIRYSDKDGVEAEGVVYGFVDYFPGYVEESHTISDEEALVTTNNYLIIANLAQVQQTFGLKPYQVWIKTKGDSSFIYDYAKKNNISYTVFEDVKSKIVDMKNDALFQGTNGILTMSFIVILILCCTGFLIYWILSIRQRELLFGVFRAMGMTKRQIIFMLVNEQIFSSGLSIVIGTAIGLVASKLFVPLVQIFYASTDQAIPLEVVNKALDMVRLFGVITIVIIVCMIVLAKLISKINISQALKLGED